MGYYHTFLEILPKLETIIEKAENTIHEYEPSYEVYNPFHYGMDCYFEYLKIYFWDYCPEYTVIGLNPGIDGAVQTCIPFTDAYNCLNIIKVDPCKYVKLQRNIDPSKYVRRSQEPTSKIFFRAVEQYGEVQEFLSRVILLNAFPLGMSCESMNPNHGGFYAKNVTYNMLKSPLKKKIYEYSKEYLNVILSKLHYCKNVTLGEYSRRVVSELSLNAIYHIHPSPLALRTHKVSEEQWIKDFLSEFRPEVIRLKPTISRKVVTSGEGLTIGTGRDYEFHRDVMEDPFEFATFNLRRLASRLYSIKTDMPFSSFILLDTETQIIYFKYAKQILKELNMLTKDDIDSIKSMGLEDDI